MPGAAPGPYCPGCQARSRRCPPARPILIIDDSSDLRSVLHEALTIEGYRVLEASDGRKGVRFFQETHPDLVLLDIIMPEKDGIETLREILALGPDAKVITFSGRAGAAVHNETAEILGAVASFRKLFAVRDILTAVRHALAQSARIQGSQEPDVPP